jgi:putative aminopeptidase FrvX
MCAKWAESIPPSPRPSASSSTAKGGPVKGVVGNVAPHLTKSDRTAKCPKWRICSSTSAWSSRKEAERLIRVGRPDHFERSVSNCCATTWPVARAFDNRVGTFAVAEALRQLKEGKGQAQRGNSGRVQHHGGSRFVGRAPDRLHAQAGRRAGGGCDPRHGLPDRQPAAARRRQNRQRPRLTHGGCNHPEVVARLEKVAKAHKIKLQHEASSNTTGTDTDVIFWTRGGIPSALISLPNRYMHSPVEVVSLKDLEQIPRLMAAFAKSLKKGEKSSR